MTIYSFIVGWGWVSTSGFKNEADTSFFPIAFLQSLLYHHHLAYLVNIFFFDRLYQIPQKFHKFHKNPLAIDINEKNICIYLVGAAALNFGNTDYSCHKLG